MKIKSNLEPKKRIQKIAESREKLKERDFKISTLGPYISEVLNELNQKEEYKEKRREEYLIKIFEVKYIEQKILKWISKENYVVKKDYYKEIYTKINNLLLKADEELSKEDIKLINIPLAIKLLQEVSELLVIFGI